MAFAGGESQTLLTKDPNWRIFKGMQFTSPYHTKNLELADATR
jgi:hypothetical protein